MFQKHLLSSRPIGFIQLQNKGLLLHLQELPQCKAEKIEILFYTGGKTKENRNIKYLRTILSLNLSPLRETLPLHIKLCNSIIHSLSLMPVTKGSFTSMMCIPRHAIIQPWQEQHLLAVGAPTWRSTPWTTTFSRHLKARLCISRLHAHQHTVNACRCACIHISPISLIFFMFWQTEWMTVLGRSLPNEKGGCCRWGRRGGSGCTGDGHWESRLSGAPQSAGRQAAAAATAAAGGGVGHGGGRGFQCSVIPVWLSHQTMSLLTHRYTDKPTNTTYRFYCSCPPFFRSIYFPLCCPLPQMDGQLLQLALVSESQQYTQQRAPRRTARMLHHSLILATLARLLWL